MKFTIDGTKIEAKEGMSVLDAALEAGIFIPHLCKHPDLEAAGGCRLCVIEIDGKDSIVPACKTMAEEEMVVSTKSDKVQAVRKMAMELILASHPADCTGCPKYGKCELQSMYQYMGVSAERWRAKPRPVKTDESNPLIKHMFTRCIRCGRCVRVCRELRGVKVLDYQKTEEGICIGIDGSVSLKEAGCRFCGACIEVCPTGSIMDAIGFENEKMSYAESVVPCRSTCPAHVDIPSYIRYIKEGNFAKAAAVIREKVPFPEILGSVCSHTCESKCKRNELGEPISICGLKLAAAENDDGSWKTKSRNSEKTGKKAAVIGAGPAGLTAAYYLVKKGHEVTVLEENEKAGGQCRYGIPAYRLPDELLDREIAAILETGVKISTGNKAEKPDELLEKGYDAVLIAVGTHEGTKLPIEGSSLDNVSVNTEFLKQARMGTPMPIGERVMVLGGGNVAYDCARTAIRLGAKEVHIACLENKEQMTAAKEEMEQGREEGIILHSAHSFLRITGSQKAEGVELQEVEKFYFDENHKAIIELAEGTNKVIPIDHVIFAVGQKPKNTQNMGVDLNGTYIKTNNQLETNLKGVFAAGDVVTGTKSVIEAIAAGRKSAETIDIYLGGDGDITEPLIDSEVPNALIGRREGFAQLERVHTQLINTQNRMKNFEPIEKPLSCEQASCEAERCLQCDLRLNLTKPKLWNEYQ